MSRPADLDQQRWKQIADSRSTRNSFCASIARQRYPITRRQGAVLDKIEQGPMRVRRRTTGRPLR